MNFKTLVKRQLKNHQSRSDDYLEDGMYQTSYAYWNGYLDLMPLVESCLDARTQAATSSWKLEGRQASACTKKFKGVVGNGNQSFKQILNNMLATALVCGDSYARIEQERGEFNLFILPPDGVTQIVKDGKLTKYRFNYGKTEEYNVEDILHFSFGQRGSMTHGISALNRLEPYLLASLGMMYTYLETSNRMIKPSEIFYFTSSDRDVIKQTSKLITDFYRSNSPLLAVPEQKIKRVEPSNVSQGQTLDPMPFFRYVDAFTLNTFRCSEVILGTGTVNSEESARHQFTGFRQAVRWDQQLTEEFIYKRVLRRLYNKGTPELKLSYATEAEEEQFTRELQGAQTIAGFAGNVLPPELATAAVVESLERVNILPEGSSQYGGETSDRQTEKRTDDRTADRPDSQGLPEPQRDDRR